MTRDTSSDAFPLFWEAAGEGPTVVLIHAAVADSRMWDALFATLSQGYRCIRYDVRGFGRSPFPPGEFSQVDDLETLFEVAEQGQRTWQQFISCRQNHLFRGPGALSSPRSGSRGRSG